MIDFDAVEFTRVTLGERIQESGTVFYSPLTTLAPGQIYLMGHNPGGRPGQQTSERIAGTLDAAQSRKLNAFIGEDWGHGVDGNKIQRSIKKLFAFLQIDLNTVFTTNLIFFRSHDVGGSDYDRNASLCWTLHEKFLAVVDPKILIVFGNSGWSPFSFLFDRYHDSIADWLEYPSGYSRWKIRRFSAVIEGKRRLVFGFPHFSRYMVHTDCQGVAALHDALKKL